MVGFPEEAHTKKKRDKVLLVHSIFLFFVFNLQCGHRGREEMVGKSMVEEIYWRRCKRMEVLTNSFVGMKRGGRCEGRLRRSRINCGSWSDILELLQWV